MNQIPMNQKSDESNLESELRSAIDRLKLGDFQTRWEAAKNLPDFGTAAIDPLLILLAEENDENDWELFWFIARILGNLNEPTVITALVNLLKPADTEVAGMAAMALANYGAAAVAPLSELLQDDSMRLLAVQSLVQIRHTDVVAPLLNTVNDPSPAIRSAAIEALSHYYDPAISAVLLAALDDLNPVVRKAAIVGLGIQAHHFDKLELTEHLKQRLWDFNLEVCSQAAIALGRVGTDAAADALFEILRSSHTPASLQLEAVRALAWMDTVYGLKLLQVFLHQSRLGNDPRQMSLAHPLFLVQQEVITVLGRVESSEAKNQAIEILLDLLHTDQGWMQEPRCRQTIALSLGQLGQPAALDALIDLLADTHASVRFHAIAALKQLDSDKAYQRLQELAVNENIALELQVGVALALKEWSMGAP